MGIELGPGDIITGAAGALVFGVAGYFSADWIAGEEAWASSVLGYHLGLLQRA